MKKIYILSLVFLFGALQAKTAKYLIEGTNTYLIITEADITKQQVDAIVNPANENLAHYGTLAKKISDAAGPELQEQCNAYPIENGHRCPTGNVVVTSGFNLPASAIFHAVGPQVTTEKPSKQNLLDLHQTYITIMRKAQESHIQSIAIPSISTGAFGYPVEEAARIAIDRIVNFVQKYKPKDLQEVRIILWDKTNDFDTYERAVTPLTHKKILSLIRINQAMVAAITNDNQ